MTFGKDIENDFPAGIKEAVSYKGTATYFQHHTIIGVYTTEKIFSKKLVLKKLLPLGKSF